MITMMKRMTLIKLKLINDVETHDVETDVEHVLADVEDDDVIKRTRGHLQSDRVKRVSVWIHRVKSERGLRSGRSFPTYVSM